MKKLIISAGVEGLGGWWVDAVTHVSPLRPRCLVVLFKDELRLLWSFFTLSIHQSIPAVTGRRRATPCTAPRHTYTQLRLTSWANKHVSALWEGNRPHRHHQPRPPRCELIVCIVSVTCSFSRFVSVYALIGGFVVRLWTHLKDSNTPISQNFCDFLKWTDFSISVFLPAYIQDSCDTVDETSYWDKINIY